MEIETQAEQDGSDEMEVVEDNGDEGEDTSDEDEIMQE